MQIPLMVTFGGEKYELRTHYKGHFREPYFPGFSVTPKKRDNGFIFEYKTVLRKQDKTGRWFDIPVKYEHFVGDHMHIVNPSSAVMNTSEALLSMITSTVYRHLILYNTSNDEPSEYQIDEELRLKLMDKHNMRDA